MRLFGRTWGIFQDFTIVPEQVKVLCHGSFVALLSPEIIYPFTAFINDRSVKRLMVQTSLVVFFLVSWLAFDLLI